MSSLCGLGCRSRTFFHIIALGQKLLNFEADKIMTFGRSVAAFGVPRGLGQVYVRNLEGPKELLQVRVAMSEANQENRPLAPYILLHVAQNGPGRVGVVQRPRRRKRVIGSR